MSSWIGSAKGRSSSRGRPTSPMVSPAWRPWVLEEADATLRMRYTGSDGTSTILTAERSPGGGWERLGVAIDAGFAGESDSYGAESPCVVKTPGGYLMVWGSPTGRSVASTWRVHCHPTQADCLIRLDRLRSTARNSLMRPKAAESMMAPPKLEGRPRT